MHTAVTKGHVEKRALPSGAMTVFGFVAATLLAASSAAPTPLYRIYQETMHLTPLMTTVVFAIYAFSLLAALLTVGDLSDHVGRKPVIFASLALNAVAMVLFASADAVGQLVLSRVVQGFAVGTGISALGAAILDTDRVRGPVLNSVFIFVGLMAGSFGSAVLVTFAPDPLHLVYMVLFGLTAVMAVLTWAMPETTSGKDGALASLRPHVHVPPQSRAALLRLTPANVAGWAFGSFYLALMPAVVAKQMGAASPMIGGVVVASLMAAAAMAVAVFRNQPARRLLVSGTAVMSLGIVISLFGIAQHAIGALFTGTIVAGVGFGAVFSGTLRTLLPTAHPHQRAGLLSAFYVQSYLAFSLPTIAAGLAVPLIGLSTTAYWYGSAIILLALVSMIAALMTEEKGGRA